MVGSIVLGLSSRGKKCAFDAEMEPVEYNTAHEEASELQKVFSEVIGTFFLLHGFIRSIMGQRPGEPWIGWD